MNGGHYVTFCKKYDQNWYRFDYTKNTRFADLTDKFSPDYEEISRNAYLLFYQKTNSNLQTLSKKLSDLKVSQDSPLKLKLLVENVAIEMESENDNIDIENDENGMEIDDNEFAKISKNNKYDDDDDDEDDENISDYADQIDDSADYVIVDNIKMFFTFRKGDELTSGLLTINNVLQERKFYNEELNKDNIDDLLELWPEYENLSDILKKKWLCIHENCFR